MQLGRTAGSADRLGTARPEPSLDWQANRTLRIITPLCFGEAMRRCIAEAERDRRRERIAEVKD